MLKCWHYVSRSSQRCLLSTNNPGLSRHMALLSTANNQDEEVTAKSQNSDVVLKNILASIRKDMPPDSLVEVTLRLKTDLPADVSRPLLAKAIDEGRDPCQNADKLQELLAKFEDVTTMDKMQAKAIITCHKTVTHLGLNTRNSKAVQTLENR